MPVYDGIDGVVRKRKEWPVGINGVVRQQKEHWAGIDGVKRKIFSSGPELVPVTVRSSISWLQGLTITYINESGSLQTQSISYPDPLQISTPLGGLIVISGYGTGMAFSFTAYDTISKTNYDPYAIDYPVNNAIESIALVVDAEKNLSINIKA